jgi:hypothetical protein
MSDKTQFHTSFFLFGDELDPDFCSAYLDICPTKAHRKGMKRGGCRPVTPTGEWSLNIIWHDCYELEADIRVLFSMVYPIRKKILYVAELQKASIGVCSAIRVFNGVYPKLELSKEIIGKLADIHAEYGIDWYDYTEVGPADGQDCRVTRIKAGGMLMCETGRSFHSETDWLPEATIEDVINLSLDRLVVGDICMDEIRCVRIDLSVEVHREERPLFHIPNELMKRIAQMKVSIGINWKKFSDLPESESIFS